MSVRRQRRAYFWVFFSLPSRPNSFFGSPTFPFGSYLKIFNLLTYDFSTEAVRAWIAQAVE
jgi:hypothetical protein